MHIHVCVLLKTGTFIGSIGINVAGKLPITRLIYCMLIKESLTV